MTDAQAAVTAGSGASVDSLIQYHFYKKSAQVEMDLGEFIEAQQAGEFEVVDI